MAQQGRAIDESTIRYLQRLREVMSVRKVAKEARVAKSTAQKYLCGKKAG